MFFLETSMNGSVFQRDNRGVAVVVGLVLMLGVGIMVAMFGATFAIGLSDTLSNDSGPEELGTEILITQSGGDTSSETTVQVNSIGSNDHVRVQYTDGSTKHTVRLVADESVTISPAPNTNVTVFGFTDGEGSVVKSYTVE